MAQDVGYRIPLPELPLSHFSTPTRLFLFSPDLSDFVDQMDREGIRTKLQRVQQGSVWRMAWPYASLPPANVKCLRTGEGSPRPLSPSISCSAPGYLICHRHLPHYYFPVLSPRNIILAEGTLFAGLKVASIHSQGNSQADA